MDWMSKHWRGLLGALLLLKPALEALRWLISLLGDIDFIATRIQDPGWIADMIDLVANPPGWALLLMIVGGFLLIFWDRRWSESVAPSSEPYLRRKQLPRQASTQTPSGPKRPGDTDLVSKGLRLRAVIGPDGADVTALLTLRNRSLTELWLGRGRNLEFEVDGRRPPTHKWGGGFNAQMSAGAEQLIKIGPIRILRAAPGVKGHLFYQVKFGTERGSLTEILSMRFDFTIKNEPSQSVGPQILECEIEEKYEYSVNALTAGDALKNIAAE